MWPVENFLPLSSRKCPSRSLPFNLSPLYRCTPPCTAQYSTDRMSVLSLVSFYSNFILAFSWSWYFNLICSKYWHSWCKSHVILDHNDISAWRQSSHKPISFPDHCKSWYPFLVANNNKSLNDSLTIWNNIFLLYIVWNNSIRSQRMSNSLVRRAPPAAGVFVPWNKWRRSEIKWSAGYRPNPPDTGITTLRYFTIHNLLSFCIFLNASNAISAEPISFAKLHFTVLILQNWPYNL